MEAIKQVQQLTTREKIAAIRSDYADLGKHPRYQKPERAIQIMGDALAVIAELTDRLDAIERGATDAAA